MLYKKLEIGLDDDEFSKAQLKCFLPKDDHERSNNNLNTATQMINKQSRDVQKFCELGVVEDFWHMGLTTILKVFDTLSGKNKRINKFILSRQYANIRLDVYWFVAI